MRVLPAIMLLLLAGCGSAPIQPADAPQPADAWPSPLTSAPVTAAQGLHVFVARDQGHCVLCHRIDGLEAEFQGDLGPPLDGIGARLSPAQIRLRIMDAATLNPATIMPPYYRTAGLHQVATEHAGRTVLTALQIEQLVRYLATLETTQ